MFNNNRRLTYHPGFKKAPVIWAALYRTFLQSPQKVWLLQLYLPNLTGNGGIDGPKQFFTGRSRHSTRHCSLSADAIASQFVKNGKCKAVDRKSSRYVSQKVSDLRRVTTPDLVLQEYFQTPCFYTQFLYLRSVPGLLECVCPKLLGLSSIACGLVLEDSIRPCTNGVLLLHRIASAAPLNKPQTTF